VCVYKILKSTFLIESYSSLLGGSKAAKTVAFKVNKKCFRMESTMTANGIQHETGSAALIAAAGGGWLCDALYE
jgi:hypothetical protein